MTGPAGDEMTGDPGLAARERDENQRLYDTHAETVERFVALSGRPADERDDVIQDTWVRVLRNRGGMPEGETDERRWLRSISRNLIRDRWRGQRRAIDGAHRLAGIGSALAAPPADEAVLRSERGEFVRAAFSRLDKRQREVLLLRIVDGRSAAEVAEITGTDAANVRQIQFRALAALRKHLASQQFDEDQEPRGGTR
jgi:RNA polymerase sigma-70 factor (ECF subfamily)